MVLNGLDTGGLEMLLKTALKQSLKDPKVSFCDGKYI
jgi:hypothetical protein